MLTLQHPLGDVSLKWQNSLQHHQSSANALNQRQSLARRWQAGGDYQTADWRVRRPHILPSRPYPASLLVGREKLSRYSVPGGPLWASWWGIQANSGLKN